MPIVYIRPATKPTETYINISLKTKMLEYYKKYTDICEL